MPYVCHKLPVVLRKADKPVNLGPLPPPLWRTLGPVRLAVGNVLAVLPTLPPDSVDAVVTDPPYSSGGMFRGDRAMAVADKYQQDNRRDKYPSFSGDHLDARGWLRWSALWLAECHRVLKPGGKVLVFTDWRQLPNASDALQAGGFVWRGLLAWDKGLGARAPHKGYFRHQAEYLVWGTKGACPIDTDAGPYPGVFSLSVRAKDKFHMAGKPTALMVRLLAATPEGGTVLDPFCGSGTTAVAAVLTGRRCITLDLEQHWVDVAEGRVRDAIKSYRLIGGD